MNNYEIAVVLKVTADDASKDALLEKVKGFITGTNGEITETKEVGKRELAYEINKLKEGFYCYISFNAEASSIRVIENACRIDEDLLRYIIIKK